MQFATKLYVHDVSVIVKNLIKIKTFVMCKRYSKQKTLVLIH